MNKNFLVSVLSASLLSGSVFAGTMDSLGMEPDLGWVVAFSAGPAWGGNGTAQTIYLTPTIKKTYEPDSGNNVFFDGEFFAGVQGDLSLTAQGQLGLAIAGASSATISGTIFDSAAPQFANHTYNYKLQHAHIAAKTKLLVDIGHWVVPWVSGSIGIGYNRASAFNNTVVVDGAVINPDFTAHSQAGFTYTAGLGVQKALNEHWQIGVGYEFADWGKSSLNRAGTQTQNNGLSQNHFYTSAVLFNFTYLAHGHDYE